jgi:threonine/homoserine/homoserine lactone efflux protein
MIGPGDPGRCVVLRYMPGPSTLAVFALAALTLLVIPGPAVLYIVTRSVDEGRTAGLASVAGVHIGTAVHVGAAALGLSALLVASSTAFTAVKLGGAAYLVIIGLRRLLTRGERADVAAPARAPLRRIVAQGAVVNILNPKTALFFLAFLPQFVDTSKGHVGLQVLMLGALFMLLGLMSDGTYALVGAASRDWLRRRLLHSRRQRYITGGVYITLGAAAALAGSSRHA